MFISILQKVFRDTLRLMYFVILGFISCFFPFTISGEDKIETEGEQSSEDNKDPNILFIMSDDHAAHAIGAYGGRLASLNPTPNIDRLAEEGILFSNVFCTNAICVPSRATIMTGQYSHTNGIRTLIGSLPPKHQYLVKLLSDAGYQTAIIGKWHLGREPAFDYYAVLPGQGNYFNPVFRMKGNGEWPNNIHRFAGYDSKHVTDVITELTIDWLKNRKNEEKPFFLMWHFKAPHDNFENAERYDWSYTDVEIPEPRSLWERGNHGPIDRHLYGTSVGKRNLRRNMGHHMYVNPNLSPDEYKNVAYQRYLKKFLRCVKGVDDGVDRLLDYLESSGLLENTIIIYTADQGFMLGEHDYIDKRWMYEESMRMPFIVRYPRWIKPGRNCNAIINNVDFAPTLLDIAGVEVPDFMQGRSFLPMIKGEGIPKDWRNSTYYRYWMHMAHHDNPAHYGIRTERFKLIFFYGLPLDAKGSKEDPTEPYWELYDLEKDPYEMNNVYKEPDYKEVVKELKEKLLHLKEKIGDTDKEYPELMKVRKEYWEY